MPRARLPRTADDTAGKCAQGYGGCAAVPRGRGRAEGGGFFTNDGGRAMHDGVCREAGLRPDDGARVSHLGPGGRFVVGCTDPARGAYPVR